MKDSKRMVASAQERALRLWGLDRPFSFERAVADFYLLYNLQLDNPARRKLFEEHIDRIVDRVKYYLDAASGGELRHALSRVTAIGTGTIHCADYIDKYLNRARNLNRWGSWILWKEVRTTYGDDALTEGIAIFSMDWGHASYGGRRWANVMDCLQRHERGEYSKTTFLDTSFGIEHNCGPVFNKIWGTENANKIYMAAFSGDMKTIVPYGSLPVRMLYEGK